MDIRFSYTYVYAYPKEEGRKLKKARYNTGQKLNKEERDLWGNFGVKS
jgi:hypothetical protein